MLALPLLYLSDAHAAKNSELLVNIAIFEEKIELLVDEKQS